LPGDFPVPILIVQHMPPGFTKAFAQRLRSLCAIDVHEAMQGEVIKAGAAFICPSGLHMRVERPASGGGTQIYLDHEPADALHIPSADVLMISVAATFKSRALGVILTGMGNDGAEGMKAIYRQGGMTIGQDESSCAVYGMPRACAELGVLIRVVPLAEIAREMISASRRCLRA
jgi:two-component system chemotaxis response regulator CheB